MKTLAINSKLITKGHFRLDGGFYLNIHSFLSLYLEANEERCVKLEEIADVMNPPVFKRQFCSIKGNAVEYFQSSDVSLASNNSEVYIYRPQAEKIGAIVHEGNILVTGFGSIGNVRLVSKSQNNVCYANNVARIFPKGSVKTGFLYAFLMSKFGNAQLNKNASGSVVRYIEAPGIRKTLIPNLPETLQKRIDDLIQESAKLREDASDSLNEAVQYFNELYKISPTTKKTFALDLNELKLGFAAYNNNLEVDEFIEEYSNNAYELRSKTSKIFAPPLFKHIYLNKDNGYPFMTGSELTQFNLRYYRWLSPRGVKDINDYVVKRGTLLLYKSGTTDGGILGNVFIVDNKLDGCCLSDHVIRIVFNDEDEAYWAFAFLRSKGAIRMLQRLATGTMIPFITPERVSHLLIPNPDDNYDHIVSLIAKYIDFNSKSKENENLAISLIEQEIESWNKK